MARRIGYSIRKLPSGRFQLIVRAADGKQVGLGAYVDKDQAEQDGQQAAVDIRKHLFIDPRASDIPLGGWLHQWCDRKRRSGKHGERYSIEARRMVDRYINPTLGRVVLTDLHPGLIARWYDDLRASCIETSRKKAASRGDLIRKKASDRDNPSDGNPGLVPPKTYRILHAALADAVRDQLLPRNPCMVEGGGKEDTGERPEVTSQDVASLAAAIEPRWSALILTAGWAGLRWGELQRLERADVDLLHGTFRVRVAKSRAGVRTVHMPPQLVEVMARHLETFTLHDPSSLVFCGPLGGALSPNFQRVFNPARKAVGLEHVHFHDLRHHAGTMTAVHGATLREIMARLGHSSPAAALRYQHAASSRAAAVAAALGAAWVEPEPAAKIRKIRG